jgi:uncharacterized protein DUF4154
VTWATPVRVASTVSLLLLLVAATQAQTHDERAVRAAFVYNLTKYVEWPQPSRELVIGFLGEGPMGDILKKMLDGKSSESRPIRVVLSPSDEELEHCHILYVGNMPSTTRRAALDRVRHKSTLTVGDTENFARQGGMIALIRVGEEVQLQVNLQVTNESQLKISSRLLNIAHLVETPAGEKVGEKN